MGVHLPWEVIHVVLGLLAEKHRNLSPISLACRVFLDFCRKHQFAKIIIDLPPTFLKYPDAIYCSSTRFAQLPDLSSPEPGVLEGIPPIVDNIAAVEVYTTDAAFPDVISTPFKMLTKLKSLHITDLRRSRAGSISIDLNSSLALGLRSVIYHSLKIPTFRELKLALGLDNFPLSLLRGTSVRSLALFDVLLSPEDGSQGYNTIGLAPATLSELQIHSKSVIHLINLLEASYPYNDASIDIRGLTKLDISQASPDCSSVLESMVALAPELRTVHLYITDSTTIRGLAGRLHPCLKTLSFLRVQVIIPPGVDSSTNPVLESYLASLNSELYLIRRATQAMNKIFLTFQFTLPFRGQTDISEHWESLDELLSSWTSLQEVLIYVLPTDRGMANSIDRWKSLRKEALKRLSGHDKIQFRFHCIHLGLTIPVD